MYNKILVPLDGSQFAECSLEHVKDIAKGCRVAEVFLLTVIEPVRTPGYWTANREQALEMGRDLEKSRKLLRGEAEDYLSKAAENLKKEGLIVQTVAIEGLENKQVADIILDYVQSNNIDMIVMSTHGRSGITRWAMGSVADKIVRSATIPVMTMAPKGCRLASAS